MSFLGHRVRLSAPSVLRSLHHAAGPNSSTRLSRTFTRPHALQLACTRTVEKSFLRVQYRSLTGVFASRGSPFDPRYFSSNTTHTLPPESLSDASESSSTDIASQPVLTPPPVAYWLLFSSALVFAVIVVGGVTRLTESGLSITEWRPITGILPPLSASEWEMEFEKYKATPEFKLINHSIDIHEFKSIFYMEWGHRVLGRLIGVTFVAPLVYFALKPRVLSRPLIRNLGFLGLFIGLQGALGWYMVKSGLEDSLMETPGAVPRVSQYRLAAHLGAAFVLYAGMFTTGLNILQDWRWAKGAGWSGMKAEESGMEWRTALQNSTVRRFATSSKVLAGLVFLTALSGAFVAGLDAGLVYNEFPLMGGRLVPPANELMSPYYAKRVDGADYWWRNIFENPTTVQFDHRCLAITTYIATTALYLASRRPALQAALPPLAKRMTTAAFAMVNVQLTLGIATLLYLVPVPLAATHQAGSVMLLTTVLHILVALRRPGTAARAWRAVAVKAGSSTH